MVNNKGTVWVPFTVKFFMKHMQIKKILVYPERKKLNTFIF
jgi:hypothetical protein